MVVVLAVLHLVLVRRRSLECVRERVVLSPHCSASDSHHHSPSVVIEFGRLPHDQLVKQFVSDRDGLVPLHYLQQNLVSVLVPEQLYDGFRSQRLLQAVEVLLFVPVATHAFIHNARTVLLQGELRKSFRYHLRDSRALVLTKQLITKLNDVIAIRVSNKFVDIKIDDVQKLSSCFMGYSLFGISLHL